MTDYDQWTDDDLPEEEEKKRRKGGLFLILLACLLILGAGAIVVTQWSSIVMTVAPPANALYDLEGHIVIPDEDAVVEDPTAIEDIGKGFTVIKQPADVAVERHAKSGCAKDSSPGCILNVPLGQARQVNNKIAPPGFKSVYWISNMGVPLEKAEEGTVYTAAHSLRNGGWSPGNALIDIDAQKPTVKPGDLMYIGDCEVLPTDAPSQTCRTYSVTETRIIPKPKVGGVSDLWDGKSPGRLILFTCLQNPQNRPSTDNMIVIGTLVE